MPAAEPAPDLFLATLGRAVRARRRRRGWTLERLAKGASLSSRFLSDVESGRGNISVLRLRDVARALGCAIADLVEESGPTRVALLGLRGAGKSTVGRLLAKRLGAEFVELDQRVEEAAQLPLAEIFALHGEAYYRRVERETLERVLGSGGAVVIAVGGSLVTDPDTFALLSSATTTVWLRATPEEHMSRVAAQGDLRPMARRGNALAELKAILAAREPLYARADRAVVTSDATPAEVAARIEASLAAG